MSLFDDKAKLKELKIWSLKEGTKFHLRKVLFEIRPLIIAKGICLFFAFKMILGHISESTKKITFGFHVSKKLFIKKSTSTGKNLCLTFFIFLISSFANFPELKVTVVIKNSRFLLSLLNLFITGNILLSSPMLAA